ncbi:hypothetical protein [Nocardia caishijiensis]|uniref:hypothetical protein n=1 Tax=Nocardia caishijiensis TaxID=184756 RepID=UPI0012ECEE8A|nr:hypothetical protein [Nocardia caishijiensis]
MTIRMRVDVFMASTVELAIPERDNDFPNVDNVGTCGYRAFQHRSSRSTSGAISALARRRVD